MLFCFWLNQTLLNIAWLPSPNSVFKLWENNWEDEKNSMLYEKYIWNEYVELSIFMSIDQEGANKQVLWGIQEQILFCAEIYILWYMVLMKYVLIDFCHQHIFSDLQRATLLGMWLIPVGFCLKFGWHRFIYVWSIFSIITAFITFKASRKPISGTTPR